MKINQRKTGAILTYLQIVLSNTIALIYTPFALRMLGQSQYGLFGTASSFTSYLSLLNLGIGGAYLRWSAKYRAAKDVEGENRLNGMYFLIFSVISVVTLVIGSVLVYAAEVVFGSSFTKTELYDLQIIIFLLVLNTVLTFFMTPIFSYIQAYEKFLFIRIVSILGILISPILNIVVLLNGGKAVEISKVSLLIAILTFVVYYVYAVKKLKMKFVFTGFCFKDFTDILKFSSYLLLNTVTLLISDTTDSVVLGSIAGTSAVAVYTVGRNFQGYFSQFSTAVSGVFAPQVNMLVAQEDDNDVLVELMLRVGRIQFYIASLILLGFAFFGKKFIYFWAGEGYEDSYVIGLLLIMASFIPLFQNVGLEIQRAKNQHKARTVVYFFVALINVTLTIPFTIMWGGIGAVLATFLCCFFGQAIFMNFYYHKKIGLNMIYFWKGILCILPSFIPTVVVGALFNFVVEIRSLFGMLLGIIITCLVYVISIWKWSMNDFEKNIFLTPVKRLFSKMKIGRRGENE